MKWTGIPRALLGLPIALAIIGCGAQPTPAKPTPTAVAAANGPQPSGQIIAEGSVVPVKSAELGFSIAGTVSQVLVAPGDSVKVGQVLVQLDTGALELQLAQAEANLAAAQDKLDQLSHTPTAEDLAAAQQNLTAAKAAYDDLLHPSANSIAPLKADVDQAQAQVGQAQAAYDRVGGDSNPNAGALPQRAQLQAAYIDLARAQALYNARLNPTNAQIQQALAAVQNATSQLANLQPSPDDKAALQAGVDAARAVRDLAAEQVKDAKLVAPFAGTVMTVDTQVGEYAAPGTVVVRLADTSEWQIETTDLTELNIVQVSEGIPVTMTLDAIPGLQLSGKVTQIRPYGESRQGDIVYTVVITPDQQDPRLRWNMTAKVSIETPQ